MGVPLDSLTVDLADVVRPRALPEEAPLDMPAQSLREAPPVTRRPATAPGYIVLRRIVVIGGAVVLTCGAAEEMYRVLAVTGLTLLECVILALYVALFAWIALAFTSAVAGFVSLLGGGGLPLGLSQSGPLPELRERTALLLPTYNEAPARVMGGLRAVIESLARTGHAAAFDVFVLSDTTDPDIWIAEEVAWLALRDSLPPYAPRLFYRRRPVNSERKAGNIADWVRRFGAAYPHMLVLDADSVMTGDSIVRLAGAMQANPGVGLIQTLPVVVGGTTLFARMQQFAGRVYGPLVAHGIAWWHGSEGNYWGHNAIIRTAAFAAHAGLPTLRGRAPFGGHILSHDFVEAALLRRAGWAVHMAPALVGSYEEAPPSLTDLAIRDRRWCQGNLQHAAVLRGRGLHWISRLHLLMGIGSYITAPMWLIFLVAGILVSLQARFVQPDYFPQGRSLFPIWPVIDPVRSAWVFVATMALLLAPKLLAYVALLLRREDRRGCGGAFGALASLLLESLIAGLIAPTAMLLQSWSVVSILLGRDAGWNAQKRDDGSVAFGQVARQYARHTLFGVALGIAAWTVSMPLLLWMSPVILGWLLAIPLAALTASPAVGRTARRIGLLRTPEEQAPPLVLARAHALARQPAPPIVGAVERLASDHALLAAHRAMLPPPRRRREGGLNAALVLAQAKLAEAETRAEAVAALDKPELRAALGEVAALDRLLELP
jgi:membrane glycosyltransferase